MSILMSLFICLLYIYIYNWCKRLPEDDLGKVETSRNFDVFYAKICIILTYGAFVDITEWMV